MGHRIPIKTKIFVANSDFSNLQEKILYEEVYFDHEELVLSPSILSETKYQSRPIILIQLVSKGYWVFSLDKKWNNSNKYLLVNKKDLLDI